MKNLASIFVGFITFNIIAAAPTMSSINYDSETYDIALEDLDNLYDYDENLSVDQAQVILQLYSAIYIFLPRKEPPQDWQLRTLMVVL